MKNFIAILMIIMLIVTGCSSQKDVIDNDRKTVNVWCYERENDESRISENITGLMKDYGSVNGIDVIINRFTDGEISYEDYILKRNLAIHTGEADIIIDRCYYFYSVKNRCGDYSRINGYESMWNGLKDRYCIPLGVFTYAYAINRELLDEYKVDYEDVITEDEYYELKRKLRDRGAAFELNNWEYGEIIREHTRNLPYVISDDDGTYKVDKNKLNEELNKAYEDIRLSKGSLEDAQKNRENDEQISRDSVTGIELRGSDWAYVSATKYKTLQSIENYGKYLPRKPIYMLKNAYNVPALFVNKTAPQAAYDVASVVFSKEWYQTVQNGIVCGPIVNEEWSREMLEVDENWKYTGEVLDSAYGISGYDIKKVFDLCYEKIAEGRIFDEIFANTIVKTRYTEFLESLLTIMDKNGGAIEDLDKRIDDFENNLNILAD